MKVRVLPKDGEAEQDFLTRANLELKNELPEDVVREALADILWKQRIRVQNAGEEFPKLMRIRHLEPGPVHYEYMNGGQGLTILVTREYMDRIRPTAVGKPIINRTHKDLPRNPIAKGEGDGIIIRAYNDPGDGWDWVDALVWDEATVQNIRNGYEPSCQHEITEVGPAGVNKGIPYDALAVNGFYEHIAIVPKGRYEGVLILMNSKENQGGIKMKLPFWPFSKESEEPAKNSIEIDSEKALLELDGKEVSLQDAISAYKEKAKNDAAAEAAKNAAPSKLSDTDLIEIDGKKVSGADLKAAMLLQAKNAEMSKMEQAHKDGDHKDKEVENCAMCNKAKNEEKEKAEEEEKEKAKNAAAALAREVSKGKAPAVVEAPLSLQDRAEKGREMFGSRKAA